MNYDDYDEWCEDVKLLGGSVLPYDPNLICQYAMLGDSQIGEWWVEDETGSIY